MRAFAFICFAVGAPDAWALLDARRVLRRSNRLLSTANFGQLKVTASDAASGDQFGVSVAIDGNTVVVGAYGDEDAGGGSGSVYVLRTTDGGATYDEVAKLTASDAASSDYFGRHVAIDGDTVLVGAYFENNRRGAVYVYRTTDNWDTHTETKLTASDAAEGDYFGWSVAIDGDTVVVGTMSGAAAYVLRTTDNWDTHTEIKLTASDGVSSDDFGYSVAIDGATVVVGAWYDADNGSMSGSAYVFLTTDGGATYDEVAKLTASDGAYGDNFGVSVAIDGDTVVVGAEQTYSEGPGAAYVYRTTDGWSTHTEIKLTASDGASEDLFGHSVAIDGETVLVGAYYDDPVPRDSGSAYVFRTSDGGATYPQVAKLTAADAAAFDEFGRSVAIDGGIIVAGAPYDSGGSVYVFSPPAPTVQPTPRPTWTFQPTPQPTVSPKPTTPQPSTAALGSDSATRAGGTLATALLAFAATALAL
jgi:hypothetical protein